MTIEELEKLVKEEFYYSMSRSMIVELRYLKINNAIQQFKDYNPLEYYGVINKFRFTGLELYFMLTNGITISVYSDKHKSIVIINDKPLTYTVDILDDRSIHTNDIEIKNTSRLDGFINLLKKAKVITDDLKMHPYVWK